MATTHLHSIIKRPLVTEKSTYESSERGHYTFVVDIHATKGQIKTAVAEAYKVRVLNVRTQTRKGKAYRTKYGVEHAGDWKKAVVELHPDDKIDLI